MSTNSSWVSISCADLATRGDLVEPRVGHRDPADVGLDRAERIIGRLRRRRLGQRVEQGRLADIRQTRRYRNENPCASITPLALSLARALWRAADARSWSEHVPHEPFAQGLRGGRPAILLLPAACAEPVATRWLVRLPAEMIDDVGARRDATHRRPRPRPGRDRRRRGRSSSTPGASATRAGDPLRDRHDHVRRLADQGGLRLHGHAAGRRGASSTSTGRSPPICRGRCPITAISTITAIGATSPATSAGAG